MADLRIGKLTIGYSIRAYMAFVFSTTVCYLAAKRVIPTEAFIVIVMVVIKAYYDSPAEIDSDSDNPNIDKTTVETKTTESTVKTEPKP